MRSRPTAPCARYLSCLSPCGRPLPGAAWLQPNTVGAAIRDGAVASSRKNFSRMRPASGILRGVLDVGLRAIAAGGGLGMPLAVRCLIFDRLGTSGHALLGGGAPGGGKGSGVVRKR